MRAKDCIVRVGVLRCLHPFFMYTLLYFPLYDFHHPLLPQICFLSSLGPEASHFLFTHALIKCLHKFCFPLLYCGMVALKGTFLRKSLGFGFPFFVVVIDFHFSIYLWQFQIFYPDVFLDFFFFKLARCSLIVVKSADLNVCLYKSEFYALICKPVNVGFVSNLHLPSDYSVRTILENSMDYTMAKQMQWHLPIFH